MRTGKKLDLLSYSAGTTGDQLWALIAAQTLKASGYRVLIVITNDHYLIQCCQDLGLSYTYSLSEVDSNDVYILEASFQAETTNLKLLSQNTSFLTLVRQGSKALYRPVKQFMALLAYLCRVEDLPASAAVSQGASYLLIGILNYLQIKTIVVSPYVMAHTKMALIQPPFRTEFLPGVGRFLPAMLGHRLLLMALQSQVGKMMKNFHKEFFNIELPLSVAATTDLPTIYALNYLHQRQNPILIPGLYITGPILMPRGIRTLPAEMKNFIRTQRAAGRRIILAGTGSMREGTPQFVRNLVIAADSVNGSLIIVGGWGGIAEPPVGYDHVIYRGSLALEEAIPQADVVITAGGSGGLSLPVQFKKPIILKPSLSDQWNSARLAIKENLAVSKILTEQSSVEDIVEALAQSETLEARIRADSREFIPGNQAVINIIMQSIGKPK